VNRRASAWGERTVAVAILGLALFTMHDVRQRVLEVQGDLDRREQRLQRIDAWAERSDGGFLAAEALRPPLFPGFRLVEQRSSAGARLVLVPQEPAR
jgi:heme exporter protein D